MKEGVDVFDRVDPLRWSTDKPTVAGWYWWQHQHGKPEAVKVERQSPTDMLICSMIHLAPGERLYVANMDGEWAGPIQEPE